MSWKVLENKHQAANLDKFGAQLDFLERHLNIAKNNFDPSDILNFNEWIHKLSEYRRAIITIKDLKKLSVDPKPEDYKGTILDYTDEVSQEYLKEHVNDSEFNKLLNKLYYEEITLLELCRTLL